MTSNKHMVASQVLASKPGMPSYYMMALISGLLFLGFLIHAWGQEWVDLNSFLLIFFICLVSGTAVTCISSPRFIVPLFLTAFLIRVVLAIIVYHYLLENYGFKGLEGNDDLYWDSIGRQLASGRVPLAEALRKYFSIGFGLVTAGVYKVGGYSYLNPRVLNSLFGAWVAVAGYHLAHEIFEDERLARRVALWLVFFPVLLFWSTAFHKDILICLFMTVGVYACLRMYKRGTGFLTLCLFFSSVIFITLIRTLAGPILILTGITAIIFRAKRKNLVSGGIGMLVFLTFALGVGIFIYKEIGRQEMVDIQGQYLDRAQSLENSSKKIADKQAHKGVSAIMYAGPPLLRFISGPIITLISPVPPGFVWRQNFSYSFLSMFQPLQLLLFPYIVIGFCRGLLKPQARAIGVVLLLPAIVVTLVANSFYAVGQITKYRIMVEPLLLILAAWVYHTSSSETRKLYLVCSIIAALLAGVTYYILRSFL